MTGCAMASNLFRSISKRLSKSSNTESQESSKTTGLVESVGKSNAADDFGLFRLHSRHDSHENVKSSSGPDSRVITSDVTTGPYAADIIAIHGLGGAAYKTWTHENGRLWLRDFALDEFPGSRIYTFEYDSGFAFSKGTGTLRDFARSLLEVVKLQRATPEVRTGPRNGSPRSLLKHNDTDPI